MFASKKILRRTPILWGIVVVVLTIFGWILFGRYHSGRTIQPSDENGFSVEISPSYHRPVLILRQQRDVSRDRPADVLVDFLTHISNGEYDSARGMCMMRRTVFGNGFIGSKYGDPIEINVFQESAERLRERLSQVTIPSFVLPGKSGFRYAPYRLTFNDDSVRESNVYLKQFDGVWKILIRADRFESGSDIDTIL